ncbi:MAG: VWA domain-containing protein [Myxococcales bacterium]|nr:VWA domain-containing protein [Myxococcales bacterium]
MDAALSRVGIEAFEQPGWLLLAPLALAVLAASARARPAAIPWPGLPEARIAGARRRDAVRGLSFTLRALCLVCLAAVLAGPVGVHRAPPEPGFGLDLVLAIDASGSMRALDTRVDDRWRTRLDLAREVVARFAEQRAEEGDRVALVVFGETAFTQCPLTSDGDLLASALGRVEAGVAGEATALGDALILAVKRALGGRPSGDGGAAGSGRVVVLLTDGRNNAGAVSVEGATSLAAGEGIRVHTVAIGSAGEEVPMAARPGAAARGLVFERHDVDARALEQIAATTGGRFFAARRSGDLEGVYAEIDALERVPRRRPPRLRHAPRPEPLVALAGGLLLVEIGVGRVARRRLP